MNKELLNDIWLLLAQNSCLSLKDLHSSFVLSEDEVNRMLNLMKEKQIVQFKEEDFKYCIPLEYNDEQYFNALSLNINSSFIDKYVKITEENKKKVINKILFMPSKNKLLNEEKEKLKTLKHKKIENIKNQNWLFILDDLKKVQQIYSLKIDFSDELDLIQTMRKEFELKFRSYFK